MHAFVAADTLCAVSAYGRYLVSSDRGVSHLDMAKIFREDAEFASRKLPVIERNQTKYVPMYDTTKVGKNSSTPAIPLPLYPPRTSISFLLQFPLVSQIFLLPPCISHFLSPFPSPRPPSSLLFLSFPLPFPHPSPCQLPLLGPKRTRRAAAPRQGRPPRHGPRPMLQGHCLVLLSPLKIYAGVAAIISAIHTSIASVTRPSNHYTGILPPIPTERRYGIGLTEQSV